MNKKFAILIFIIAIILAFFTAKILLQENFKSDNVINQEENVIETNNTLEDSLSVEEDDVASETQNEENITQGTQIQAVKVTSKKTVIETNKNGNSSLSQEETITVKPIKVTEDKQQTIDYGLYEEKDSKAIIVTRNFDSIVPRKFYFKDFGIIYKVSK
mgnify:CR=1 FL=1